MKDLLNQEYEKALLLLNGENKVDGFHEMIELNTICLNATNTIDKIVSSLTSVFINPHLEQMQQTYAKNCRALRSYENIMDKGFKPFDELSYAVFPITESTACFYNKSTKGFTEFLFNGSAPISKSQSFFHNLFNQFEIQHQYENLKVNSIFNMMIWISLAVYCI